MFEFVNVKYKEILDIPALFIEKEKITTFVGESGSGKTTILRMLNKMISPTKGTVLFEGTDLKQIDSIVQRRNVTMLSQSPVMFEGSIRHNLNIGFIFQERELPNDDMLNEALEKVKLDKSLDSPTNNLSGGEKQRIALARILLLDPKVYLLDEPSSALDNKTEESIIQMLKKHMQSKKKTIIIVTHSKFIAKKYSDNVIEMVNGKYYSKEKI